MQDHLYYSEALGQDFDTIVEAARPKHVMNRRHIVLHFCSNQRLYLPVSLENLQSIANPTNYHKKIRPRE
jgi:hypothetical protein